MKTTLHFYTPANELFFLDGCDHALSLHLEDSISEPTVGARLTYPASVLRGDRSLRLFLVLAKNNPVAILLSDEVWTSFDKAERALIDGVRVWDEASSTDFIKKMIMSGLAERIEHSTE